MRFNFLFALGAPVRLGAAAAGCTAAFRGAAGFLFDAAEAARAGLFFAAPRRRFRAVAAIPDATDAPSFTVSLASFFASLASRSFKRWIRLLRDLRVFIRGEEFSGRHHGSRNGSERRVDDEFLAMSRIISGPSIRSRDRVRMSIVAG